MNWTKLNTALVLADMPTDVKPTYEAWLAANPDKTSRLDTIITRTISEIRDAIRSNPANIITTDEAEIPEAMVRAAEAVITFTLLMEMGEEMPQEALQAATRAEMQIRSILYEHFITKDESQATNTPRYTATAIEGSRPLP